MVKTVMVDWSLLERRPLFKTVNFRKKKNIKAFIQARCASTRFPNKIYEDINGAPMLFHTINMAKRAALVDDVIVVSPSKLPNMPDEIKEFVYNGQENDVLGRYYAALHRYPCDYVVRLTSDCPLLDFHLIDFVIAASMGYDYGSNVMVPTFPDGMDVEVISSKTMDYLHKHTDSLGDREHVTTLIRNNPQIQVDLSIVSVQALLDSSYLKLSVDTKEDLHRVCEVEKSLCQK